MLRSMTGFGKSTGPVEGKPFTVEIRSLNSKYLDLNLKIPGALREREIELRNELSEKVIRGKVELVIEPVSGDEKTYSINRNVFRQYYNELESLKDELSIPSGNLLDAVMKIPDVLSSTNERISDSEWASIKKLLDKAIDLLNDFRNQEGKLLEKDMMERVEGIKKFSAEIKASEGKRKELIRVRLKEKLSELLSSHELDAGRLEEEVLYYSERLDITEELVRLASHCDYFQEVIRDKEQSKGKKLSFITQEIGREINTLGSKANDAAIQKLAVEMKEELEKIKEQVNNVL